MSSFNREAYERARSRLEVARNDLEELEQQVEDGEIDEDTAAGLRAGYEAELQSAEAALAAAGTPPAKPPKKKAKAEDPAKPASKKRAPSESLEKAPSGSGWNKRILVGGGILIAAVVFILLSVQGSAEPEPSAAPPTAANTDTATDPCAELAAALTDHADNGFRLALARCYTDTGNAMSAIEHYRAVADDSEATPEQTSQANVGLGYLNLQIGELNTAADYMEVALAADPTSLEAQYWLGLMLIYDLGDPERGVSYLESILATPDLPAETVQSIEEAIQIGTSGEQGS